MRNKVYYVKAENGDFVGAIQTGIKQAFTLVKEQDRANLKFVVSHSHLLDVGGHLEEGLNIIGNGDALIRQLKKGGFPVPDFPKTGTNTGVNLMLTTKNVPSMHGNDSVALLVYADESSLAKLQSVLGKTEIDLVAVVYQGGEGVDSILSSIKAENISDAADPTVVPYTNNLGVQENEILSRLKSMNTQNGPANRGNKVYIDNVMAELKNGGLTISYNDFLGFLVNEVGYSLDDSLELLERQKTYFG